MERPELAVVTPNVFLERELVAKTLDERLRGRRVAVLEDERLALAFEQLGMQQRFIAKKTASAVWQAPRPLFRQANPTVGCAAPEDRICARAPRSGPS